MWLIGQKTKTTRAGRSSKKTCRKLKPRLTTIDLAPGALWWVWTQIPLYFRKSIHRWLQRHKKGGHSEQLTTDGAASQVEINQGCGYTFSFQYPMPVHSVVLSSLWQLLSLKSMHHRGFVPRIMVLIATDVALLVPQDDFVSGRLLPTTNLWRFKSPYRHWLHHISLRLNALAWRATQRPSTTC